MLEYTFLGFVPTVLEGLPVALQLTFITLVLGLPLGLFTAVGIRSQSRWVRIPLIVVVEIGRGMPLLVLLYLLYQGLPQLDVLVSPTTAATLAFVWSCAAYSSEIYRGGIESVAAGQWDAAAADGLGRVDTMRYVILPQAARVSVPPLLNLSIQLFQFTSLTYAITVSEIMQKAYMTGALTFRYLDVFLAAALVYLAVTLPASLIVARLDVLANRHVSRSRTKRSEQPVL